MTVNYYFTCFESYSISDREGIKTGTLDEIEKEYIHPNLISSLDGTTSLGE